MFSFLKKRDEDEITVRDTIWIAETNKWKACIDQLQEKPETVIVVWFDETYHKIQTALAEAAMPPDQLFFTRQLTPHLLHNAKIIFAEHFPLLQKEKDLYNKLRLMNVHVYSSLDEPLFKHFGGDHIINMVKQMGLKDDEPIEHNIITAAIQNAQEKVSNCVSFEQSAPSQAEWLMKNLTA